MKIPSLVTSVVFSCMSCFAAQPTPCYEAPKAYVCPIVQKVNRAAFDIGSGRFKLVVAEIEPETKQINKILFEKMIEVRLGDDFKKYGTISKDTEASAITALKELVELAKYYGSDQVEMRGIATATFRKAGERGAELLSELNKVVGGQSFIREISAQIEGQVGLRTARIVALEKDRARQHPNVAWDCGNASFQISYDTGNGIDVFEGHIGGSDVKALFMTKILRHPVYDVDLMKYQPVSQEQIEAYIALLKSSFGDADDSLRQALVKENARIVTIGDENSLFAVVEGLFGENIYTKAEVQQLLEKLVNCPEDKLQDLGKYGAKVAYIVPLTAFLFAVMDKLNIDTIENYVTIGSTKGLLETPELWGE